MTLRRYAPIAQSRGTQIPARLRLDVLERDQGCVGPRIGMPGDCYGGLELDHVRGSGAMGRKSPTEAGNLASLCSTHHLERTLNGRKWRPVLLDYLSDATRSLSPTTEEAVQPDGEDAPPRRATSRW